MKKSKGYISHPLGKKHDKSKIEEFLNQKLLEDKVLLSSVPLGGWKEIMCSGKIMKNIFKVFHWELNATNNTDKSVSGYIINDSGSSYIITYFKRNCCKVDFWN